jgi:glycosyltransferase involved in cell wall biosynthesis
MRIVIDMQPAQSDSRYRGIGRFTISFVKELIRQASQHEIILILNAKFRESIVDLKYEFSELKEDQFRIFDVPVGSNLKIPLRATGDIMRELFLSSLKPDLVLITGLFDQTRTYHNISIKKSDSQWMTAVIHHDLIPFKNPSDYLTNSEHEAYYNECLENLKRADFFFCNSNYTKKELEASFNIDSRKVITVGAATGFRELLTKQETIAAERVKKKLKISDYILYVPGGFDKRKNFERLIKAYSSLSFELRTKYQLVIASKIPGKEIVTYYHELAESLGLSSDRVVFTDYLSEMELQFFYEKASLFVFPSLHEGFGLPVLEAMNAGCPVIGSNCTSIPEVIGLEQALFDPYSIESIAQKMKQCLEDKEFSNVLKNEFYEMLK